jgi:hypothetical protein
MQGGGAKNMTPIHRLTIRRNTDRMVGQVRIDMPKTKNTTALP